jgi:hypothetical protein
VVQISDGAVQTSGVAVKVIPFGQSEASGAGTVAYSADGVVLYTPTQGETNYTSFVLVASKSGCIPATVTVVTSASATAGYGGVDWGKVTDKTATVALTNTTINAAPIADAVWDEAYNQHTTAGTFGKLMDLLRKSNTVLEGTILASPTPTTTVFKVSGIDYPTGALEHAILWMASGTSQNQNSPILTTVNNGDGTVTVTLEEALVTAPVAGDTVLIDPTSHVHAIADIQAGLATLANQTTIIAYLDTEITAIKSVTDKLNTGLVADGAVFQFTANMLELAPGGGGGGSATLENQELILDEIDSLRSSFASAVGRLAVSSQLIGFPPSIVRNADYSTVTESEIRLSLKDVDGNPITEIGGVPCDEITWLFGLGSERNPALIEGAATWDDTNDQLVIQLAAADTADKPPGTLSWQIGCTIDETTRYLGGGTTRLLERHF